MRHCVEYDVMMTHLLQNFAEFCVTSLSHTHFHQSRTHHTKDRKETLGLVCLTGQMFCETCVLLCAVEVWCEAGIFYLHHCPSTSLSFSHTPWMKDVCLVGYGYHFPRHRQARWQGRRGGWHNSRNIQVHFCNNGVIIIIIIQQQQEVPSKPLLLLLLLMMMVLGRIHSLRLVILIIKILWCMAFYKTIC